MNPTSQEGITLRIRQSSARTFRTCEMKYKLSAIDGLVPINKSPALSVGTICHAGRAAFLRSGFSQQTAIDATLAAITAECTLFPAIAERVPTFNKDGSHSAFCKCVTCIQVTALATIIEYTKTFETRFALADLQIHSVEQQFELELASYEDLTMVLTGTADADVTFRKADMRMNFEFKTTKDEIQSYLMDEEMSMQHVAYPYALEHLNKVKYYGTLLDVIRKPTKTIPASCGIRIISKTRHNYDQFLEDMNKLLRRIAECISTDTWSQNTDACRTRYGRCDFFELCFTNFSRAAMSKFTQIEFPSGIPLEAEEEDA